MKKFLVIGNPVDHSLSPKLHNYWIKKNRLDSIYGKLAVNEKELSELCDNLRQGKLDGINVTVPFKKEIIPYVNVLSGHALRTNSINTISVDNGNLVGHNTDIEGFELSIKKLNYEVSNRTKEKAEELKKLFKDLIILDWGDLIDFDMIINATSIGLNEDDNFEIDFTKVGNNKFFYDVIYKPYKNNFFQAGNQNGNIFKNGLNMFLYQAQKAFYIWHKIEPIVDEEVINFLKNSSSEIKK